jgi:hypothetical protein
MTMVPELIENSMSLGSFVLVLGYDLRIGYVRR